MSRWLYGLNYVDIETMIWIHIRNYAHILCAILFICYNAIFSRVSLFRLHVWRRILCGRVRTPCANNVCCIVFLFFLRLQ